jgi:hypothetical protein
MLDSMQPFDYITYGMIIVGRENVQYIRYRPRHPEKVVGRRVWGNTDRRGGTELGRERGKMRAGLWVVGWLIE